MKNNSRYNIFKAQVTSSPEIEAEQSPKTALLRNIIGSEQKQFGLHVDRHSETHNDSWPEPM